MVMFTGTIKIPSNVTNNKAVSNNDKPGDSILSREFISHFQKSALIFQVIKSINDFGLSLLCHTNPLTVFHMTYEVKEAGICSQSVSLSAYIKCAGRTHIVLQSL